MNRHHRRLITIRIVVILLVGLAFLIARFAHAAPTRPKSRIPITFKLDFPSGPPYSDLIY